MSLRAGMIRQGAPTRVARYVGAVMIANDNEDEALAEAPAANGHDFVTLTAGFSLCQRCGHLWDWEGEKAPSCPPEDDE